MDCTHYTTERRKGQHLSLEERVTIELRLKDSWNINQIAKDLSGTVLVYHGKVKHYKAHAGQAAYELNRQRGVKTTKLLACIDAVQLCGCGTDAHQEHRPAGKGQSESET